MPIDPSSRKNGVDLYYATSLDVAIHERKEAEKRRAERKQRGLDSETSSINKDAADVEKTPEQLKAEKKAEKKAKVRGYILSVLGLGGAVGCSTTV
jgi:hypothetical protein